MTIIKIWVDDIRPVPEGYVWCTTVNETKLVIDCISRINETLVFTKNLPFIELIDLDHDAGDCAIFGGDYIKILDWLEKTGRNYPIRLHSMNPVGVENMRRIINRNGWEEVL